MWPANSKLRKPALEEKKSKIPIVTRFHRHPQLSAIKRQSSTGSNNFSF